MICYVDNNATTRVAPEVIEAMLPFLDDMWGNPSSMHTFGGQVAKHIATARERVAQLLGAARPDEVVFTSCGTESDNAAIRSALHTQPDKRHIVTTTVEHPAVLTLCQHLEKEGCEVTYLSVDGKGRLNLDELRSSLRDDTAIVSIMWANNETGTMFPIEDIAAIVSDRGVLLHVDAVQVAGKVPLDLTRTPIDFLALSGHKIHAPKGVGTLYIRRGTPFSPFIVGGHQERGRRGGTENVASIVGMGAAAELAFKGISDEPARLASMRDRLQSGIIESVPRCVVNGDVEHRLPNTANISFESIEGEAILLMLNEYGICASSGSACTSGSLEPSHVLLAMGIPHERAHGSIRFSLSRYNTPEEMDYILEKLPPVIERLRELSPVQ